MIFSSIISFIAILSCLGLASLSLSQNRRSFAHGIFALGMIALALEAGLLGLSSRSASALQMFFWQRFGIVVSSFLPGIWTIFTLIYGREENYKGILRKQKWGLAGIFVVPIILSTFFGKSFFEDESILDKSNVWLPHLGWSGYVFFIVFLICGVLILMNLERTYRASIGAIRWRMKFILLGLGSLFAIRIYTSSQVLLYSTLDPLLNTFNVGGLIIANILILISLYRSRQFSFNIYLSPTLLYNSFVVLIVGIYLISVGILAKAVQYFDGSQGFFFNTFLIFLLLLGLTILILSEEVRQRVREFISRHFKLPRYDYRQEWREFTKRTTSLVEIYHLSSAIVKMVAETFGVSSASIWLYDESKGDFELSGSTNISKAEGNKLNLPEEIQEDILQEFRNQSTPVNLSQSEARWIAEFKRANPKYFEDDRIVYCIPLVIKENFLGLLTLNNKITRRSFSIEDFELLKTLADQVAGNLLNLKLSKKLQEVKQMEALQTMSAFMMHDLKNLGSTLSLTMENWSIHFDNPDFRKDALQVIKQSVTKVNSMCSHLLMLSQKIELRKVETDLNKLVATSLFCLNGCSKTPLIQELQPVPRLAVDPEQIQKVLTNLILNANEAIRTNGEIRIATNQMDSWVTVSVSDNGCGISKEFMEKDLFHPFKTTKKQGMGIGLFQSKMIVEAHQGRIEVESEPGVGTTFKVMLPLRGSSV